MANDPRTTPSHDVMAAPIPGRQDNPALSQFSIERLGMEVANELGVDPNNLGAYGLTAAKIDQYESQTHNSSGSQNR